MSSRRQARVTALQVLFEVDIAKHSHESVLERTLEKVSLPEDSASFVRYLVEGVMEHLPTIDEKIREAAPIWPLEQMARIDKNILRIAIFEILINNKTPVKAVINEAVELAKLFGGESSGKFVNGVLGTIVSVQDGNVDKRPKLTKS